MTTPLSATELPPPERVELFEGRRPIGRFRLRQESFGYVVLGASLVPVTAEARPLLEACDGSVTLRQIEERYGSEGLELIVDLYRKGLVEM